MTQMELAEEERKAKQNSLPCTPTLWSPKMVTCSPQNLNVSFPKCHRSPHLPLTATGEHFGVQRMRGTVLSPQSVARPVKVSERWLNLEVLCVDLGWEFISKHEMDGLLTKNHFC